MAKIGSPQTLITRDRCEMIFRPIWKIEEDVCPPMPRLVKKKNENYLRDSMKV